MLAVVAAAFLLAAVAAAYCLASTQSDEVAETLSPIFLYLTLGLSLSPSLLSVFLHQDNQHPPFTHPFSLSHISLFILTLFLVFLLGREWPPPLYGV